MSRKRTSRTSVDTRTRAEIAATLISGVLDLLDQQPPGGAATTLLRARARACRRDVLAWGRLSAAERDALLDETFTLCRAAVAQRATM